MDLRAEAKRRLAEYRYRKHAVERLPEEIRRLEIQAARLGAAAVDTDPVKGGGSQQEEGLLKNIEAREMLAQRLRDNVDWVESVEDALKVLTGEEQYILQKLEIESDDGSMEEVRRVLGSSRATLYRQWEQAMDSFTMAIYGGEL